MKTDGRFYTGMTGLTHSGNEKYSEELKLSIEQAGALCLENLNSESYSPIMLLGSIQSGKTRAFIGLMSLCFDNDFDMTIILTKCSTALVRQTVSRMMAEFDHFKEGNATVGDVVAQDILDIDFKGTGTMAEKENVVRQFLQRYRGKKRIIVVKKQADNVDRVNMFVSELINQDIYKRILVVDDEADITSIGYDKTKGQPKGQQELSLRRISGSINAMRKQMHSSIEHVLMQVTATPYALYLQPASFMDQNIMPVKPRQTVVLPTGDKYVGGKYYFMDSEDEASPDYNKARHLLYAVDSNEMSILNGTAKNSGGNPVIADGRVVKTASFLRDQSAKPSFALPSLRDWLFDILVGTAMIQHNPDNEGVYVSAVFHVAIAKKLHKHQRNLFESAIEELVIALENDITDADVLYFAKQAYDSMTESVSSYSVLTIPTFDEVMGRVAKKDRNNRLEGLINEIDIKSVNSDNEIAPLLNEKTGELKLENSITIFIGGQVLDRGITIPNLINFFYGRTPGVMQQDTVMQHCRMFGYRTQELLSVTRLYTTYELYESMKEITIRDEILRTHMLEHGHGEVIYLEAGGRIKACSPQKVLASNIKSMLPDRRYLPVGFNVKNKEAKKVHAGISEILKKENAFLPQNKTVYNKGKSTHGHYVVIDSKTAIKLLELSYSTIEPIPDGTCNKFSEIEPIFWFSMSEKLTYEVDEIALIVRENRDLGKMKRDGKVYQDAPDDGNNEGALAKALREQMPVLVMTEQTNREWGETFWWPVFYTPSNMNIGIYAEEDANTGVSESINSLTPMPMMISEFVLVDTIGTDEQYTESLISAIGRVEEFYQDEFCIPDLIDSTITRKGIECLIFIDEDPRDSNETVLKELKRNYKKANEILESSAFDEEQRKVILSYFSGALENNLTDQLREQVLGMIESDTSEKIKQRKLKQLVYMVDDLLKNAKELLGYFRPVDSTKCEIHIHRSVIEDTCIKLNHDTEDAFLDMSESVIAHEMYHALHYADIMTRSGRWLYRNKDYIKQGAVQESLAEYFTLCYVKADTSHPVSELFIRKNRDVKNFPSDGGYSGALILESKEKASQGGNMNKAYARTFEESLNDMPKAYVNLI